MMQNLLNIVRREVERVVGRLALPKTGIVTGYDPANYAVKVRLQPQDVETGWLPVRSPWAGNGWGMFCPPGIGDEVEVQFQEGGKLAPYVSLRAFGDKSRPLPAPAAEFWLQHKSGSLLKFKNDGSVELHAQTAITSSAPVWNHTGDVKVAGELRVTGDIYDLNSTRGTVGDIRTVYNSHTHSDPQGGVVSAPSPQLP